MHFGISFLYLLYTLIKLYYTKALSDQASSLAPIEFFSSGGQESLSLSMIQQQPFRINLQLQVAHATQYQKNKQPSQKMGQRAKQTFLQRRHTDDQ